MLVEENARHEESSVIVLKLNSSNCSLQGEYKDGEEDNDDLNINNKKSNVACVNSKITDDSSKKHESNFLENRCRIPVDYQLLPEEFFECQGIPPPLVSRKWLKCMNEYSIKASLNNQSSEDSEDESIPLVKLIKKLKSNQLDNFLEIDTHNYKNGKSEEGEGMQKMEEKCNSSIEKSSRKKKRLKSKTKNQNLVNRKRGRPKKVQKESITPLDDRNLINEVGEIPESIEEDLFWNNESNSSSECISLHEEAKGDTIKENNFVGVSYNEHDYFKPVDNVVEKNKEEKDVLNDKKRKKDKIVIQGIKTEDSKLSFPCSDCGKAFSAASTLKHHLRIHNGTLLKCTECHKGFTTKYLLKCHMRIHNGDLFMCHKCGKGFITAELLKVHSRGHTGDRPFACNICDKTFPSASNLSQHKQTHETEKKYLCFQCGSSFSQKRCLDGHMLTHSEKSHICTVCGKLWARKSDLREHMRVHTGVKPYCCDICPQKFTQASSLKRHKIVHLDVKPIQCLTCNKLFKCQQYYKRHVRKHETEADYLFSN